MSHILAQWLNDKVHLSQRVAPPDLDAHFKSGFLLAELLHRYDFHNDLSSFSRSNTVEAAIRNYTLLEPTLREKLHINFDSNRASALIDGQSGSAAELLYEIKSALKGLEPLKVVDGKVVKNPAPKETRTRSGIPVGQKPNPARAVPTVRPEMKKFLQHEHEFFAARLKQRLKMTDQAGYRPRTGESSPSQSTVPGRRQRVARAAEPRPPLLNNPALPGSTEFSPALDDPPSLLRPHAKLIPDAMLSQYEIARRKREEARVERERQKIEMTNVPPLYPLPPKSKRRQAEEALRSDLTRFEKNLESIPMKPSLRALPPPSLLDAPLTPSASRPGSGTPRSSTSVLDRDPLDMKEVKRFVSLKAAMDPVNHVKMLSRKLPKVEGSHAQSVEYLKKIRSRKLEEEASRKEREQRRRKIILAQQHTQEELEATHVEELMLYKLMRQSKQERRIAEQLMQVRHDKEVMRENRAFREQQYAERRERDYEDALAREHDLAQRAREEYAHLAELQLDQHREILAAKRAETHRKHYAMCSEIVRHVVDLAINSSPESSYENGKPSSCIRSPSPSGTISISKRTESGHSSPTHPPETDASTGGGGSGESNSMEVAEPGVLDGIALLDDSEFLGYLNAEADWAFAGEK
ncbi:hypothetical protein BDK51DRAFT_40064 [Blyttiomyces helicus]|uniref:Calponin-homology (CH) domain-containing protein n=1 Tax=Blyttiomyces helicus TaxID=388810 RepID=A0A4P9W8C7_9FUNG|nr:hypothetical protein BDK51DRAFT_40064 [Blyttiomyces helicus]|eukprot:RKO88594.1 hypothetical protein BDK51DRAFT_40064 [Blyttiomyces helicus]